MLVKGVTILMVGILVIIKPNGFKRPFGEKDFFNNYQIGIFAIVALVFGILKELKIFNFFKIFH
jgi:hypothetical protein